MDCAVCHAISKPARRVCFAMETEHMVSVGSDIHTLHYWMMQLKQCLWFFSASGIMAGSPCPPEIMRKLKVDLNIQEMTVGMTCGVYRPNHRSHPVIHK